MMQCGNYFLRVVIAAALVAGHALGAEERRVEDPPNIVVILTDDQGYADVGYRSGPRLATPHLDRLAAEGVRFDRFYVAQAVCSASRTALLTGCYPNRLGIVGALGPNARHGIADGEMTLAELAKQRNYSTAIFGKWHLGHHPQFLPTRHGFDEYFGLPYSNDMWPKHPTAKFPGLPLMEGEKVVAQDPDQTQLTTWYTERAVQFIERNRERPFFLYVAHAMPHVPLFVSEKFRGKSGQGLYGDVLMEIDWSVGEILAALERNKLERRTWVIFVSDNGPWLSYGEHAGSAQPLREGKGTSWEGGVRVPCAMRWPGMIPAGSICRLPAMTIDLFPTIARVIGAKLPEHKIDGLDIWPLIAGQPGAENPHDAYYFYYNQNDLEAVLDGPWKLYFPHSYRSLANRPGGTEGRPANYGTGRTGLELYNVDTDVSERRDVSGEHPQIVERLQNLAERARVDLGDQLTRRKGENVRSPGRLPEL